MTKQRKYLIHIITISLLALFVGCSEDDDKGDSFNQSFEEEEIVYEYDRTDLVLSCNKGCNHLITTLSAAREIKKDSISLNQKQMKSFTRLCFDYCGVNAISEINNLKDTSEDEESDYIEKDDEKVLLEKKTEKKSSDNWNSFE